MSRSARLKFDEINRVVDNDQEWIEVSLSCGGRSVTGRSPSADLLETRGGIRRTALATLDGVMKFVDGQFTCELQEIDRVSALGKELVVLLINLEFEGRRIQLFGSCRTGEDVLSATAKAALDATNRYIDIVANRDEV
jgi:hypothetical protein